MEPLKKVRKERQKPAHRISENYYDVEFFKKQMILLDEVRVSLGALRFICKQHPLTANYKIKDWIENSDIKNF